MPIMQAPIGRVQDVGLVLAVARAGGLGTLGAAYLAPTDLRRQIQAIKRMTDTAFCVNLILAFDQEERVEIVAEEGVPWLSLSWGINRSLIRRAQAAGTRVMVQVSSETEARDAVLAGADALVVQGVEAGGHVQGNVGLIPLLERIRGVPVPIVAAGGIADPAAAKAAFALGADAVAMGTRFAASDESLAHPSYRKRLVEGTGDDTVLTDLFDSGSPPWKAQHRVIRNHVYEAWDAAGRPPSGDRPGEDVPVATAAFGSVPRYAVVPPVIGMEGDVEAMAMYAGQGVGAIGSIESAATIVDRFAATIT